MTGFGSGINDQQVGQYITQRAGRLVNLLLNPVFLSKAESSNQYIALELSDDDYALLSHPDF